METIEKITLFTKDEVIKLVAIFANTYKTESFLDGTGTVEKAIDEVKNLIDFKTISGNEFIEAFDVYAEDCPPLRDGRYERLLIPASDYREVL